MTKRQVYDTVVSLLWWLVILGVICLAIIGRAQAQVLTPADAEKIRVVVAERNSFEKEAELQKQRADALEKQRDEWRNLYLAEKERADVVQEKQIEALRSAVTSAEKAYTDLDKAYTVLKAQFDRDGEYIKTLERRNESLKKQRWIFGVIGFAGGTLFGGRVNF